MKNHKKKTIQFLENYFEYFFIFLIVTIIYFTVTDKEISTFSKLPISFKSHQQVRELIHKTSFKLIDEADLTNSTLITAEYFSCDNKTSFLIIETSEENFIFQNVPLETWENFKKSESKDIFYFSQIKDRYDLNID
jgi:hypothetical protein